MIGPPALDIACRIASALSPGTRGRLARGLAALQYRTDRSRREAVRLNLRALAAAGRPDLTERGALERTARSMFASYHLFLLEYLAQRRFALRALAGQARFQGMETLYRALAPGRGAVVCVPHIGNWELAGLALARLGLRIHVVTGVQFHRLLSGSARAMKEAASIRVSVPEAGFAPLLGTLRAGGLVVLLVDGDVFTRARPARLFGRPIPFPAGPALLVRRTGATLLHAHAERTGADSILVSFDGADRADPSLPLPQDLDRLTARTAAALERCVTAHVEQWCLFRPLFEEVDAA